VAKTDFAVAVDKIQGALKIFLKEKGFRCKGRAFNRVTGDGLVQVIGIQMGPFNPPGTHYIPWFRENYHGLFTVNLGICVPEVARYTHKLKEGAWIQEYDCCVRARLGEAAGLEQDAWWPARYDSDVVDEVAHLLESVGIPFLERYATRDKILIEWRDLSDNMGISQPPRIVMAIILAERGEKARARDLLATQALETTNPGHPEYVRQLADKLAVGGLDI
jgi:hypothetical protein